MSSGSNEAVCWQVLFDLGCDCSQSPALEAQAEVNEDMGRYVLKNLSNADKQKHFQCFNQAKTIIPPYEWVSESCSVVSDSLQSHGLYSPWNSPDQNTGVGSFPLLRELFPTQGSNPGLPHCRRILYQLSHKGSPGILPYIQTKSSWKIVLLFWQISFNPYGLYYQDINLTINYQAWTSITLMLALWYTYNLEKEKATHSSMLAGRISWTEEPGGLQSIGLQRVGHDWATNTHMYN